MALLHYNTVHSYYTTFHIIHTCMLTVDSRKPQQQIIKVVKGKKGKGNKFGFLVTMIWQKQTLPLPLPPQYFLPVDIFPSEFRNRVEQDRKFLSVSGILDPQVLWCLPVSGLPELP